MKKILVFGAGRSAYYCIKYLLQLEVEKQWQITIADGEPLNIRACNEAFPGANTKIINVLDGESRQNLIKGQDVVVSLLPAMFHVFIAKDCLEFGVHLVTPSYISKEMDMLNHEAISKKITMLNELGLDPGIDHISTMNIINRIKSEGGKIISYKSYCGGVMSKASNDNPWGYKIVWNPYNIVRAGQDGGMGDRKSVV